MWKKRGNVDRFFYNHAWLVFVGTVLFVFFGGLLAMRFIAKASWGDSYLVSGLIALFIEWRFMSKVNGK